MRKQLTLFLVLSLLFAPLLIGIELAGAQESATNSATPSDTSSQNNRLYLDFKGASLINVLMVLSELSGINFVAGKEVANREVNMVLDNVVLEDALDAIGRGSNVSYDYFPNRNLYLFRAAADKEDAPRLVARVFKLYYIRASELREVGSDSGTSSSSGTGGSSGSSSGGATFSGLNETKVSDDPKSPILNIVKNILSERGKVNVDDRSNSLVVTDTEDRLKMIEQAIAELDRPVDQVLISVILVETLEDIDHFLGIEWGGNTTTGQEGTLGLIQGASMETRFPFNVNDYSAFTRLFGKTSLNKNHIVEDTDATTEGIKDFTDLDIRFRALQTANKVKILARPKILVLDNQPALIKITTNTTIGAQTSATSTTGGAALTASTTSAERTETGTSLRVTPLINTNNHITMTLEPRFVTIASSGLTVSSVATRDPTVRTARTTLMVNSGQTIVIGGLLSSQQAHDDRKVPILGDIPYVGEIFTRRTNQIEDRELMLFITPIIVKNPAEVQAVSVPDQRDRFEDLKAPFWKWKRKSWYQKLKEEPKTPEVSDVNVYIPARDQLMDETMVNLARTQQPKEEPKQDVKTTPSGNGKTPAKSTKLGTSKSTTSKTSSSFREPPPASLG